MSWSHRRPGDAPVSVLLPVRDGGAHLPGCIRSLRAQTLADFEVIAVDDGSTEASPDLLAFVECPVAHATFFMRADAVASVGGYQERGWPEDYDLLLRLWEAGGRFAKVPEVLLEWREGGGRLSRTVQEIAAHRVTRRGAGAALA